MEQLHPQLRSFTVILLLFLKKQAENDELYRPGGKDRNTAQISKGPASQPVSDTLQA
jgi:hypothetical protein